MGWWTYEQKYITTSFVLITSTQDRVGSKSPKHILGSNTTRPNQKQIHCFSRFQLKYKYIFPIQIQTHCNVWFKYNSNTYFIHNYGGISKYDKNQTKYQIQIHSLYDLTTHWRKHGFFCTSPGCLHSRWQQDSLKHISCKNYGWWVTSLIGLPFIDANVWPAASLLTNFLSAACPLLTLTQVWKHSIFVYLFGFICKYFQNEFFLHLFFSESTIFAGLSCIDSMCYILFYFLSILNYRELSFILRLKTYLFHLMLPILLGFLASSSIRWWAMTTRALLYGYEIA